MKKIKWLIIKAAMLLLVAMPFQKAMAQDGGEVSYQEFYDQLSPYGQWVDDPQYGNVWVPNVGSDFRPYGNEGHWVMTEYGNTWVSDYPWGWAPFHYGRWTYSDYYGWTWIPGYEWGPAWVNWRNGGGYYGWAPLGPNIGISVGAYNCPIDWWVFIQPQYMYRPDYYHYWGGPRNNGNIYGHTTIINNYYRNTYVSGPRADEMRRATHQDIPTYRLSNASRPGEARVRGNALNIYRPVMNRATANTARPANVVRAPQAIGAARPATGNPGRTPAFHAQMQQNGGAMRNGGNTPAINTQRGNSQVPRTVQSAPINQRQQQAQQPQMQQRQQQAQQQVQQRQLQVQQQQRQQQTQQQQVQQRQQQAQQQQVQQRQQQVQQQQRQQQAQPQQVQQRQQQMQQQQRQQQAQQQQVQQRQQQVQQQQRQQQVQQRQQQVQQQQVQQRQQQAQQQQQMQRQQQVQQRQQQAPQQQMQQRQPMQAAPQQHEQPRMEGGRR